MQPSEAHKLINNSERRTRVLASVNQPLTAKQIGRRIGMPFDACREVVRDLAACGLVRCLNEDARRSRVYWLNKLGKTVQQRLFELRAERLPVHFVPNVDWALYGFVCFSHRSTIIKTLSEPMQPATIKRKARSRDANLRMSANNVRDIIRLFRSLGIVRPVPGRKRAHLRYELTEIGRQLQQLLWRAEAPA